MTVEPYLMLFSVSFVFPIVCLIKQKTAKTENSSPYKKLNS